MSAWIPVLLTLSSAFAIEGVRVEVGDGSVLEKATVLVGDDGRIQAVGEDVRLPSGVERIDGSDKTLTPGFIETRAQLGLTEVLAEESTNDHALSANAVTPAFRAADGFQPLSVRIPIEREEGITSAVTSPTHGLLAGTGSWFDLTGELSAAPDPSRPLAMFGSVAQGAVDVTGGSRGALWLRLREVLDDVREYDRNRAAYARNTARTLSLSRLHLEAMVPVVKGQLPLVLEAHRASDVLAAVRLKREEGIEVIVAGGAEAWLVAKELAAAKVPVILRPSTMQPWSFEALRARDDSAALLAAAGVKLVLSAAGQGEQDARRLRQEAGIAVAHGLDRDAALRAITLSPAEVFGKASELGSVTPRKRANLVLWSGDPLELSTVAERVWIDGRAMSLENRQRALAEKYLQRTSSSASPSVSPAR